MERFSLGFKMKMPKGYCAKIYGRLGMTVKHGIHLAGGVSIIEPDFRGPISICLKNSHRSHPYEIKVNDRVKPRKATPQSAAFNVYSCSHKTIYPGQMERFSLGFKMKMPKGYCAKIYGRSGMTVKHGIHLAGGVSITEPDFRGPISICLKNLHRSHPYEIKVNDQVTQMIERVDNFKCIEGTENDLKTEGVSENTSEASENASEAQCGRKRTKKLEGFRSTGI